MWVEWFICCEIDPKTKILFIVQWARNDMLKIYTRLFNQLCLHITRIISFACSHFGLEPLSLCSPLCIKYKIMHDKFNYQFYSCTPPFKKENDKSFMWKFVCSYVYMLMRVFYTLFRLLFYIHTKTNCCFMGSYHFSPHQNTIFLSDTYSRVFLWSWLYIKCMFKDFSLL